MKTLRVCWFPVLLFAVAVLAAGLSHAQTPAVMNNGLSWAHPTERTDGSPLAVDAITGYRILCGPTSNPLPAYPLLYDTPTPVTSISKEELMTIMGLAREVTYFCALRTHATCDGAPCTSERSNEVSFIIPAEVAPPQQPPVPPTLTVQEGAQTAYTLVQSENRLALVPVGTVPAGTECDTAQQISDANGVRGYVVPRSVVQWAGTVRPQVVVAQCG